MSNANTKSGRGVISQPQRPQPDPREGRRIRERLILSGIIVPSNPKETADVVLKAAIWG